MADSDLRRHHSRGDPWIEPLDAYRRLRHDEPLLLDGMGAHPEARYAYLALGARLEARLHGDRITLRYDDGSTESRQGHPLELVRDLTEAWHFQVDEPEGFTGGFVGYFGYEFARAVEPTLPPPKAEPATPDMALRLCRDVVVFDRVERTVTVWATDLPGESGAQDRLQRIWDHLGADPGPAPEVPTVDATWQTSLDAASFGAAVETVRGHVRNGDLFQANIATRFRTPLDADPVALYAAMRAHNPSPYMALLDWGDHVIVSNSPEQLFAVREGTIRTRPIAGTRPRGTAPEEDLAFEQELLTDEKEQAEHTMLVDLLRNDIAKVSRPGSVRVAESGSVERYRHVMHLVSRVQGDLRPGTGFADWLAALFPGGTITGAPKHRACLRIHEAEPVPRGPYTGSAGFLSWSHNAHWNILIRTLVLQDGQASVQAGSGIVMDSDPAREWAEAGHKARSLLDAATGRTHGGNDTRLGEVSRHGDWRPDTPPRRVAARVLLVDNYDSFVQNLADYCAALGADVQVVRNDEDWRRALAAFDPTHILLGPGPGTPEDSGATLEIAREMAGRIPILGVCLGHQAICLAEGADVVVGAEAVHGKTGAVHHDGSWLLAGLPTPLAATRYHSLVVDPDTIPVSLQVTARLEDGTVMAVESPDRHLFGLQFHPESLCTPRGLEIVLSFLETRMDA